MDMLMTRFMMFLAADADAGGGTGTSNIDNLLKSAGSAFNRWGQIIVFIIGVIMVIAAIFFIAKGLMSQGRGQTNWALTIILLILGGAFMATGAGGWKMIGNVTGTTTQTLNEWAAGSGATNYDAGFDATAP